MMTGCLKLSSSIYIHVCIISHWFKLPHLFYEYIESGQEVRSKGLGVDSNEGLPLSYRGANDERVVERNAMLVCTRSAGRCSVLVHLRMW